MSGYDMARELEAFARRNGFTPPQAYYIVGEFNLRERNGKSVYSDEAHLWCEACAKSLLKRAHRLMPKEDREDHFVCATDASGEDCCPHCMACGETLHGTISDYCVSEELANYDEHPIYPGETINPRQAVQLAMVLSAAPENPDVLALGKSAIDATKGGASVVR